MMKIKSRMVTRLVAAIVAIVAMSSCSAEPHATDLEFSYKTFTADEGSDSGYVSVYLMYSPYKFPVVVDMEVEMLTGRNADGEPLALADVLTFVTTDKSYTVTSTGDRTARIENVEVTYTEYSQKVYFECLDNDFLQNETVTVKFTLTKVDGSEMGSITETTLTIVDDEKAPRIRTGYYKAAYTAPAEAKRTDKGEFYLTLSKVGKYQYVASGWFGLDRPRLLGTYNPTERTLTFDGTDYDHTLWELEAPVNAFRNDTIWAYSSSGGVVDKIIRMAGSGAEGTDPIVITTEAIEQDKSGVAVSIDSECGMYIYSFDASANKATAEVGIYDALSAPTPITFSKTNYPTEQSATRAATAQRRPLPFADWCINF